MTKKSGEVTSIATNLLDRPGLRVVKHFPIIPAVDQIYTLLGDGIIMKSSAPTIDVLGIE
jgi:hypothetical protein